MDEQLEQQVSDAFAVFLKEAPGHAAAWMDAVQGLGKACVLDEKTAALSYLAVLAATGLESGIPFHAREAKAAGASREEVLGAVLIGLPAAGQVVIRSLPPALRAFDAE